MQVHEEGSNTDRDNCHFVIPLYIAERCASHQRRHRVWPLEKSDQHFDSVGTATLHMFSKSRRGAATLHMFEACRYSDTPHVQGMQVNQLHCTHSECSTTSFLESHFVQHECAHSRAIKNSRAASTIIPQMSSRPLSQRDLGQKSSVFLKIIKHHQTSSNVI